MPLRPDLQPDNAGGAGAGLRPAAARVRERSRPGDGVAPLRREEKDGSVGLGIGRSGGASTGGGSGCSPDSSDESPVAWLLCSLAAVSALQSLDRGVVNLLRSAHLLAFQRETRIRGSARDFLGRPMKRSAVEIKRRGFLLFYFFSTISTCPIDSGPGAVVVYRSTKQVKRRCVNTERVRACLVVVLKFNKDGSTFVLFDKKLSILD
jgi:hypothetical protein